MTVRLPTRRLLNAAFGWPRASQLAARRNALVASTALAQVRRERDQADAAVAAAAARHAVRSGRATHPA
jgi:hypothetical protein